MSEFELKPLPDPLAGWELARKMMRELAELRVRLGYCLAESKRWDKFTSPGEAADVINEACRANNIQKAVEEELASLREEYEAAQEP